jgi:thioredoxin reductase (NADPH)
VPQPSEGEARLHVDRLAARENVSFLWDSEVTAILGDEGVSGVRLRNVKDGTSSDVECMGLFPFIGATPSTRIRAQHVADIVGTRQDDRPNFATADSRVFAVGAARAEYGGNLVQAMAEGVGAAEAVGRLLH